MKQISYDASNAKKVHLEFIDWLKTKKNVPRVDEYIKYVTDYLSLYEKYEKTGRKSELGSLTVVLNRYRDEFKFDYESVKTCRVFFGRMREEIAKLPD